METKTILSLDELGRRARDARYRLGPLKTDRKNAALEAIADELEAAKDRVLEANAADIRAAESEGMDEAMLDRLRLDAVRVDRLAVDTRSVADLPDPVGTEYGARERPNGLRIAKRRIPLGVVGVIYEARPNVTIDVASLCLKTGNAVILRGGSETLRSNVALVDVIRAALAKTGVPEDAVQYIENTDRTLVTELLRMDRYVDMIIPRGGAGLHRLCREQSTIPVITGGIGVCHVFVDASADLANALDIVENAKVQRPSVCNALDTLLVHRTIASDFLPEVSRRLARSDVKLVAADDALEILSNADGEGDDGCEVNTAGPEDFDREWLGLTLGVRIVDGLDEAVSHIQEHSTDHSDSILTKDDENAEAFLDRVTSAAVYVNASTRFTDGGQFGLGAEVAVSTQMLHARGPMGLEELTSYKWVVRGEGQIRT